MAKKGKEKTRKVLVILSNRFLPNKKPRYLELDCAEDGSILKEAPLKRQPAKGGYDEVWQNDEGRDTLDSCNRIRRLYRHAFEKKPA